MGMLKWAVACVLALGAGAPEAQATTGLAWQFDSAKPFRYALTAEVKLPEVLPFIAEINTNARVALFRIDLVTTCTPTSPVGKKAWEIRCDIDDVRVAAVPVRSDIGLLQPVLDEYDAKLLDAHVQLVMTYDGRVRSVGLEGIPMLNSRLVTIQEVLRLVMVRAFSSLDLQLPKKADDGGRPWRQNNVLAAQFPDTQGTMGSLSVEHAVASSEGSRVEIISRGKGLLGSGEMVAVGNREQPKNMYNVVVDTATAFDVERGVMLARRVDVVAEVGTSTAAVDNIGAQNYVHMAQLYLLAEDEVAAPLPENQELSTVDATPVVE
jgi:hypothetical protein